MITPKGRREVLAKIVERQARILKADQLVKSLIDRYLAESGTSVDEIKKQLEHLWVSDADAALGS